MYTLDKVIGGFYSSLLRNETRNEDIVHATGNPELRKSTHWDTTRIQGRHRTLSKLTARKRGHHKDT
jgi:hypothetical protein